MPQQVREQVYLILQIHTMLQMQLLKRKVRNINKVVET